MGNSGAAEVLTDDCGPLEQRSLRRLETVEPACEQRLDRRRDRLQPLGVDVLGDVGVQLLDEERVSLGGLDDARADLVGNPDRARQLTDQQLGVVFRERVEDDRLCLGAPAGPLFEELGSG